MKFLAIPNAHALAHVSRLLEVAKQLRSGGHEVLFAGHGRYLSVARNEGFEVFELPGVPLDVHIAAIQSQKGWKLFPFSRVEKMIAAELELYQKIKPEIVLLDNRPTARTSAEMVQIPSVAILNVHMSNHRKNPYYQIGFFSKLKQNFLFDLIDRIENFFESAVYEILVNGGLRKYRKNQGLKRLFGFEHEEGDYSLLADIEEFNPVRKLSPTEFMIGPLTWNNNFPQVKNLEKLDLSRPIVYLSLGSDSLDDLLLELPKLTKSGFQFIIATGGGHSLLPEEIPPGVIVENFVNTEKILSICSVACCHGGNGTIYQALTHGVPLVVVASHEEQYYGGKRIARLGLGVSLTLKKVKKHGVQEITSAIELVLKDEKYRLRTQEFSQFLKKNDGAEKAAQIILQHI